MTRHESIEFIKQNPNVTVLIIGAGINGVGLYRDLSLQGVDAYLVDKSDYASGASAASSHMIHGGLRYLENREFRLVQESLRERNLLLQNAPHYVHPLPTTIPIFHWFSGFVPAITNFMLSENRAGNRGALLIKVGLSLYDFYSRSQRILPPHTFTSRRQALQTRPQLNDSIVCTATYYDAWMTHPERIALEQILDIEKLDTRSRAVNYLEAVSTDGEIVALHDKLTGENVAVKPTIVVNATGAWIDFTNQALNSSTEFIGGTKGSHLVIDNPALYEATAGHMIFFENQDGRVCILFPYLGKVLAGSTDIRVDHPDEAQMTPAEAQYIRDSIQQVFPDVMLQDEDTVFHYCGVRPLPKTKESTTGKISRDHKIEVIEPDQTVSFPIFSLVGGKWTTFRAFGEQVTDHVLSRLNRSRKISTQDVAIGGGTNYPRTEEERAMWISQVARESGISEERMNQLFSRYGTRAREIAHKAGNVPLKHHPDYSRGEIEFIVAREHVQRLSDIILRRTTIAILGETTYSLLDELSEIIANQHGWREDQRQKEIESTIALLKSKHGVHIVKEILTQSSNK